jgi:hypothetical protein
MENRSVTQQDLVAISQTSTDAAIRECSLTEAELQSLVQFFQLLDRWDQEVVQ